MKKIAIFASGSGTNAQNIIKYFANNKGIIIDSIYSNNKNAFVLERAKSFQIPTYLITRENFYKNREIADILTLREIDLIVLAGFLWLVPDYLIRQYKIINIHPALLPKYGGKGMYGMIVHEAVVNNKESESGITIHYVNENYDEGEIIFQASCKLYPSDTPEKVAEKVHKLEYKYFPGVIERVLSGLK